MRKISKKARKQIINITVLVALIGLTITVLFASNKELNFKTIGEFLASSNPLYLCLALVGMLLFIFFEGLSLHIICHKVGHKCKLGSSMIYSTADLYYSAITPSAAGGQPASVFYMVKDGMSGGSASFTVIFNIIGYTASIIIIGLFAIAVRPGMFVQFNGFVQFLVILGIFVQLFLLGLFIACIFCHRAVLACGNGIINILHKIHLIKYKDKWRAKLANAVDKYESTREVIGRHHFLFLLVLFLAICQRASQILITCFVCYAVDPNVNFLDLFALQTYVTLGYNALPLPGGVGAFEYMYLNVFSLQFERTFILAAVMITRAISYYLSTILCGVATLSYHVYVIGRNGRRAQKKAQDVNNGEENGGEEENNTDEQPSVDEQPADEEQSPDGQKDVQPSENSGEEAEKEPQL